MITFNVNLHHQTQNIANVPSKTNNIANNTNTKEFEGK